MYTVPKSVGSSDILKYFMAVLRTPFFHNCDCVHVYAAVIHLISGNAFYTVSVTSYAVILRFIGL